MNFAPISTPATTEPAAPVAPPAPAAPAIEPPAAKPQTQASVMPARAIEHMPISKSSPATSQPAASKEGSERASSSTLWTGMGSLGQVGAALAIVIGLILVGKALARKFIPGARATNGKGVIEILARHPLAKNQSIVLVRIGSQIVALNQGRETSESILVVSEPTEVAKIIGQIEGQSPSSIQAGFTKLLANARMDLEQGADAETEQEGDLRSISPESLDEQLEEMAAAKRQLMELRQHVRSVRDSLPRA
jgi:flagellar biogenesis protein FliO